MRALVLTSSPKEKEYSVTQVLASQFAKGMREAGADVEGYDLTRMNIKHCMGCGACSTVTNGHCIIKDEMTEILYTKFIEADVVVLATPIYFGMLNAVMKNFIERLFPYLDPKQIAKGDMVVQNFRGPFPKIVAISAASWHKSHAFMQMSAYLKYLFDDKLIAELYRGNSDAILFSPVYADKKNEILEAAFKAGEELAKTNAISQDIIEKISQDLDDLEKVVSLHNLNMKLSQEENVTIQQYIKNRLHDHGRVIPKSVESFVEYVELFFKPKGEDTDTDFSAQFVFNGDEKKYCFFDIKNGKLTSSMEKSPTADITLKSSFETISAIVGHQASLMEEIMNGRVIVKGKIDKLNRVGTYLLME